MYCINNIVSSNRKRSSSSSSRSGEATAGGFEPVILAIASGGGGDDSGRAAAAVLDGGWKVIFIETFICVSVHTCAGALSTRERWVQTTHALIGRGAPNCLLVNHTHTFVCPSHISAFSNRLAKTCLQPTNLYTG